MSICLKCVLPDTFPGIRFNEEGICNFCQKSDIQKRKYDEDRVKYRQKFLALSDRIRLDGDKDKRSYDVIMAYSGGKDSSYTLMLLKKHYGLNVLALTFDNGFISSQAFTNIGRMIDALDVDHIFFSPSRTVLMNAFRRSIETDVYPMIALERASAICNTCMNLVKAVILKTAVEMAIPFVAYGWSPGQAPVASSVMKLNVPMIRQMQDSLLRTTGTLVGEKIRPYILNDRHYSRFLTPENAAEGAFLYAVHPLAFHEYQEDAVAKEIKKFGWLPPTDTDPNSTNCLLNVFANHLHVSRYGFHPYAFEIAGLVRFGCMTREEGLSKLAERPNPEVLQFIQKKLDLVDSAKKKLDAM